MKVTFFYATICLIVMMLFMLASGCGNSSDPQTRETFEPNNGQEIVIFHKPDVPNRNYAGSESCRECHSEISERFSSHPMGNSAGKMTEESLIANYNEATFETVDHTVYQAIKTPGKPVVHREQKFVRTDSDIGNTVETQEVYYQHDEVVNYFIGSGSQGRSYLIGKDDRFYQSPMTWYSLAAHWNLSPGYSRDNLHFERVITDGCLSCHVGRVETQETLATSPNEDLKFQRRILEPAIGCERCHGPSADHVQWHQESRPSENSAHKDPILNLSTLNNIQSESLCTQCHLVGNERILRYGRTEFDFRPGDILEDIWLCFIENSNRSALEQDAVSQVEQMHQSVCFENSSGMLNCISCHDPHGLPSQENRVEFYRTRCQKCHSSETSDCGLSLTERVDIYSENSCIDCHMPAFKAKDVPHTAATDHRILKRPLDSKPEQSVSKPELVLFNQAQERVPELSVERGRAILMSIYAQQHLDQYLASVALKQLNESQVHFPDDPLLMLHVGLTCILLQKYPEAESELKQLSHLEPLNEQAYKQLGLIYHKTNELQMGIDSMNRYLEINPWDRAAYGRKIHMLGQSGKIEEGIRQANIAIEKFPDTWQIHRWLSEAYRLSNQPVLASEHEEIYQRTKPHMIEQ
ncbi:MAG TPA: hypothetical protein DD473_27300 [Planctomycetaceae bacterium]|nr:hypothetical protein [Planctomycetaceae bacterium]